MASLDDLYRRQAEALEALERKKLRETIEMFARSKRGLAGRMLEYDDLNSLLALRPDLGAAVDALTRSFEEHLVMSMTDAAVMGQDHILALGKAAYGGAVPEHLYSIFSSTLGGVPERVVQAAISRVWAGGMNLKDIVWKTFNPTLLAQLENKLVIGISQGRSVNQLARDISQTFDAVRDWQALRLVRTETMGAYREGYREAGNEKSFVTGYDWLLSNAEKNCDVCIALAAGSPYDKDKVPSEGDTHPNCMCQVQARLQPQDEFISYLREKYAL